MAGQRYLFYVATVLALIGSVISVEAGGVSDAVLKGVGPLEPFLNMLLRFENPTEAMKLNRIAAGSHPRFGPIMRYLGIEVTDVRVIAQRACKADKFSVADAFAVMDSPYNEERLFSIFLLQHRFERAGKMIRMNSAASEKAKGAVILRRELVSQFVPRISTHLNRWNLVNAGVQAILGAHVGSNPKAHAALLHKLAESEHVWDRRAAVIAARRLADRKDYSGFTAIAEKLLDDRDVQRTISRGLSEIGDADPEFLTNFLEKYRGRLSEGQVMLAKGLRS